MTEDELIELSHKHPKYLTPAEHVALAEEYLWESTEVGAGDHARRLAAVSSAHSNLAIAKRL